MNHDHSPGPWHAEHYDEERCKIGIFAANKKQVAEICYDEYEASSIHHDAALHAKAMQEALDNAESIVTAVNEQMQQRAKEKKAAEAGQ